MDANSDLLAFVGVREAYLRGLPAAAEVADCPGVIAIHDAMGLRSTGLIPSGRSPSSEDGCGGVTEVAAEIVYDAGPVIHLDEVGCLDLLGDCHRSRNMPPQMVNKRDPLAKGALRHGWSPHVEHTRAILSLLYAAAVLPLSARRRRPSRQRPFDLLRDIDRREVVVRIEVVLAGLVDHTQVPAPSRQLVGQDLVHLPHLEVSRVVSAKTDDVLALLLAHHLLQEPLELELPPTDAMRFVPV